MDAVSPSSERFVYRCGVGQTTEQSDADPIATEIVRNKLNSAANQIKRTIVRTAFSPVIYEVLDFAVAIYGRDLSLLAQAPTLPAFMGTLNFCVESAVAAVGGEHVLEPGDILLYNVPYGTGSHAPDCAVVMPVFLSGGELVGYTAVKAHLLDIGGKDPYSTDTIDVFQEGTIYPGVKLYRRGVLNDDVWRIFLSNSRVPKLIAGDVQALVAGVRAGAEAFVEVVERHGGDAFGQLVTLMFDHGERLVRSYISNIPDGTYRASGQMDNNGVDDDPIPFDIVVTVAGSDVTVDFSLAPEAQRGPVNCLFGSTVSAVKIALTMLAGANQPPHEGFFRPLTVITRPGSMFHPVPPTPCFLYLWPALQAIEVIYAALGQAMPQGVPASSGGDLCGLVWWGTREATGEPWADGAPHPVGQGASARSDGATMMHIGESATRFSPIEVWETKNPWVVERVELAPDSGGPGRHRGGPGVDFHFRVLEDCYVTPHIERSRFPAWGLEGGGSGRPNLGILRYPDGSQRTFAKATRMKVPKGAVLELQTGGGGGYGPPHERDPAAVLADLRDGLVSVDRARSDYPQAFSDEGLRSDLPTKGREARTKPQQRST